MTPLATYRLQFGPDFGFADAAALAPYLAALGVSHVYLAPIFTARPGSTHGYDVTDPTEINPELGGGAAFRAMATAFRTEGLGILLDIVPNHMGIGATNRFWLDVLAWGRESRFAAWFDIDWDAEHPGLAGKVLVPVLGDAYGPALTAGALELRFEREEGSYAVWAHQTHKLPVSPRYYSRILANGGLGQLAAAAEALSAAPASDPRWSALAAQLAEASEAASAAEAFRGEPGKRGSWNALDELIAAQNWRAAKFSLERDALNYRRFFAISDLAGLRVEDATVFDATHQVALALVNEGVADGLRIDHVDGLRDPKTYCRRLRKAASRPFWLLVEKILAHDEALPAAWEVDGTTGYEVANLLVGLLVDPAGEQQMTRTYLDFAGRAEAPDTVVREAKREVLQRMLGSECDALTKRFLRLAARGSRFRDLGRGTIRAALVETIAALDVYRTYADATGINQSDRDRVLAAVAAARRKAPWLDPEAFDLVAAVLTLDRAHWPEHDGASLEAALRFQQLSGPAMAKGLEDTALYRYARLIALNEVGSGPGRIGTTLVEFHAANVARLARSPRALLATSTHDTKRGEDARARIAALPRHAGAWARAVQIWHALLADAAEPIDQNEEYFFYQLLFGVWPTEARPGIDPDAAALAVLAARVREAMIKSVREAGRNTRWVFGDADYEARVTAFVDRALAPAGPFLRVFRAFEAAVANDGAANSLIQTALKLTIPGIPDIYRGAEVWEQSLVDPDNRRPVDFTDLTRRLATLPAGAAAFAAWTSPTAKLALVARLLAARRANPALFVEGSYEPLDLGPAACGFLRRREQAAMLVVAALRHEGSNSPPVLPSLKRNWREVLTETSVEDLATVRPFAVLPVAAFFSQ